MTYTPGWMEVRDAYAEGNSRAEAEFDRYEMGVLYSIADRLEASVFDTEAGAAISWNEVLSHLGYPTVESRQDRAAQVKEERDASTEGGKS